MGRPEPSPARDRTDPTPARRLRVTLTQSRQQGITFDEAWADAIDHALAYTTGRRERADWATVFDWARPNWKAGSTCIVRSMDAPCRSSSTTETHDETQDGQQLNHRTHHFNNNGSRKPHASSMGTRPYHYQTATQDGASEHQATASPQQ